MELILKAGAIAVTGTVLALALRKNTPETAMLLSAALGCLILYLAADVLRDVINFVRKLTDMADVPAGAVAIVLKTAAIAIVTKFASDVCKDAGQSAAAAALELAGCAAAVYVMIPLMETVLDMVNSYF